MKQKDLNNFFNVLNEMEKQIQEQRNARFLAIFGDNSIDCEDGVSSNENVENNTSTSETPTDESVETILENLENDI